MDKGFLADVALPEELDRQTVLLGDPLGVFTDLVAERFGEVGIVEDPHLLPTEKTRRRLPMADIGKRSRDDDAIEAGEDTDNLVGMAISECGHGRLRVEGEQRAPPLSRKRADLASKPCLVPATPGY